MAKAYMMVDVYPGEEDAVYEALKKIAGIEKLHQVTGEYDMIAFIEAKPYNAFARVVDMVRKTRGVRDTDTQMVLR